MIKLDAILDGYLDLGYGNLEYVRRNVGFVFQNPNDSFSTQR